MLLDLHRKAAQGGTDNQHQPVSTAFPRAINVMLIVS